MYMWVKIEMTMVLNVKEIVCYGVHGDHDT